ncbi:sulfur carrier protein ThiS adenylyltransferase ThiF [Deferribacteraceae bacterium V6Fe1]|nr:sulfur carrier protein ThiS adenylyltransferase ThiF [Deferribacteraceae bacterium V6Fe1]
MKIFLNEKEIDLNKQTTIEELKNSFKPDADVIIYNGHMTNENISLKDGDSVFFIKKGEMPNSEELEYLMAARHTPGVHKKLKKARVAIAGLGGLGSNIAINLARMGIGYIKLIDFDIVEPSNLNRQQYFIDQIGMFKTDAMLDTLKKINPYIHYEAINIYVKKDNVEKLFGDVDVIIEAFDKAENKAMLISAASMLFKDKCIIGASGVAGLYDTSLFKVKKLGEKIYIVGDFENEAKPGQGLMATRVAVAANIQANLAVNYILEEL